MTGAIDFLRKAKAICEKSSDTGASLVIDLIDYVDGLSIGISEADLVRKVMDYKIKEDKDAERNQV